MIIVKNDVKLQNAEGMALLYHHFVVLECYKTNFYNNFNLSGLKNLSLDTRNY